MIPKIKLQDFLGAYEKEPNRFILNDDYVVIKVSEGRGGYSETRFGLIDMIFYKVWKWDLERRKNYEKEAELAAIMCAMRDEHRYDDLEG